MTDSVAFAVALSNATIQEYSQPDVRQASFNDAHKFSSVLAVNQLKGPPQVASSAQKAIAIVNLQSIVVVRVFAILVEVILGLVSLCSFGLLAIARSRVHLLKDPASIEDVIKLLPTDLSTFASFFKPRRSRRKYFKTTIASQNQ